MINMINMINLLKRIFRLFELKTGSKATLLFVNKCCIYRYLEKREKKRCEKTHVCIS